MGFAENFEDLQIWQRACILTNEIYDAFESQIKEKPQYCIAKADVGGLIVEGVKREMCLQNDTFYVMNCKWKFHLVSA